MCKEGALQMVKAGMGNIWRYKHMYRILIQPASFIFRLRLAETDCFTQ